MNPVRRFGVISICAGEIMLIATLARAQTRAQNDEPDRSDAEISDRAEDAFWRGKRHYDAGEFEQAREQFEKAHTLINDPSLLYNIAQSYRQLGDCARARDHYWQFLQDVQDSPHADNARRQLRMLEDGCPKPLPSTPPAAPSGLPPPSVSEAAPPGVASLPIVITRRDFRLRASTSSAHSQVDYWAAGLLAGGLVLGATAGVLELWNHRRYSTWQERDGNLATGNAPGETDEQWAVRQGDNDQLWRSVKSVNSVAVGMGIGAGALVATAAVLHFAVSRSGEQSTKTRVAECQMSVGATNGGLGWTLEGRF